MNNETTSSTTTWKPCQHKNGFYTTIPKSFGRRREVMVCTDCESIIDRRTKERV